MQYTFFQSTSSTRLYASHGIGEKEAGSQRRTERLEVGLVSLKLQALQLENSI